jgi:Arc/MetJ-type ribon-helix-helix transcriptional regulator
MTIRVADDLARFVEEAIRSGQFASADDVVRDALVRLRETMAVTAATTGQSGEPVPHATPLTKHALLDHLAEIGLVDTSTQPGADPSAGIAPSIHDEDEIISDKVIRERLIEWLVGFLPKE